MAYKTRLLQQLSVGLYLETVTTADISDVRLAPQYAPIKLVSEGTFTKVLSSSAVGEISPVCIDRTGGLAVVGILREEQENPTLMASYDLNNSTQSRMFRQLLARL